MGLTVGLPQERNSHNQVNPESVTLWQREHCGFCVIPCWNHRASFRTSFSHRH